MADHLLDSSDNLPPATEIPDRPDSILVAEDEHLLAASLSQHLQKLGFSVVGPASNGRQALEMARETPPDLAILDIRMPEMGGVEVAHVLFCQMGIPVVFISAFSDPEYVEASAKIGVFGYLLKPLSNDELRVSISVAWSRYVQHCRLRGEVAGLKQTLENRKIIEKAKGVVMKKLGLGEDEAMKQIQKKARDSRRKLVDLARAILDCSQFLDGDKKIIP